MASRAAKLTFLTSILFTSVTVFAVHYNQQRDRDAMHAGIIREEENDRAKKAQKKQTNMLELERQAQLRIQLEAATSGK